MTGVEKLHKNDKFEKYHKMTKTKIEILAKIYVIHFNTL